MGKLKSFIKQIIIRKKFSSSKSISHSAILSKDCDIGIGSKIGDEVVFDTNVRIGKNVKVGKQTFLSNIIIGDDSIIESEVVCAGTKKGTITVGKNSYIGIRNILDNSDDISIGDFVQIAGPSTSLWTHRGADMALNNIPLSELSSTPLRSTDKIIIENNVYIGCNCTIYPGITIKHHSIIAPNSAVTKNVESLTMVGGVPAVKIKDIVVPSYKQNC